MQKLIQLRLGALRGQEFRTENLRHIGIQNLDQNSESIHVDSESSIKNRTPASVRRSYFRSRTQKESFKENEKFDSPLELSLNLPIQAYPSLDCGKNFKYGPRGIVALFIQKLKYYTQKEELYPKYNHIVYDLASDDSLSQKTQSILSKMMELLKRESFEQFIFEIIYTVLLIMAAFLAPFIITEYVNIYCFSIISISFILQLVLLVIVRIVIDKLRIQYVILLVMNIAQMYNKIFGMFNLLLILMTQQQFKRLEIITYKKQYQLLVSIINIMIYLNFITNLWVLILNESYGYTLNNCVALMFSFHNNLNIQDYYEIDTVIRIANIFWLTLLIFNLVQVIEQHVDDKKCIKKYDFALTKSLNKQQSLRTQYQLRKYNWDKIYQERQNNEAKQSQNENISSEIKILINQNTYQNILNKDQFVQDHITQKLQKDIISNLQEQIYFPGDVVLEDQSNPNKLCVLIEGQILLRLRNRELKIIENPCILNSFEFFSQLNQPCQLVANKRSKVAELQLDKFNDMIRLHQQDFESIKMWQDKINFNTIRTVYKVFHLIIQVCYICNSKKHFTNNCSAVHFYPRVQKLISDSLYPYYNMRLYQQRPERKRYNSRINQNVISILAVNYAQSLNLIAKNDAIDIYLGQDGLIGDDLFLGDDDHTSKYQRTQTYTAQQSNKSVNMTGRERVQTFDSNINRTLTLRTLKASDHDTQKINNNKQERDSIIGSSQQIKQNLIIFQQRDQSQNKRTSNVSNSLTIDRVGDKKSSFQSNNQQAQPNSTSILLSQQILQQVQSNLGSPNMHKSSLKSNLFIPRSDPMPHLSDFLHDNVKDFDCLREYEWYYASFNVSRMIEKYQRYLIKKFAQRT